MKKLLTLSLAAIMVLMLALLPACGNGGAPAEPAAPASPAGEPAAVENPSEAPEDAPANAGPVGEPVKLTMSSGFDVNDMVTLNLEYFCDQVEELSGGSITFERFTGGTLASVPEQAGLITDNAVDVCAVLPDTIYAKVPYIAFPFIYGPELRDAIEYAMYITSENEETAALIKAQAAENNMAILSWVAGGWNSFCTTSPVTSFADMTKLKIADNANQATLNSLGITTVNFVNSEAYDSLSRGVFDGVAGGVSNIVLFKYYEVAPYVLACHTHSTGVTIVFNNSTLEKLSPEQQDIIYQAAELTTEYGIALGEERDAGAVKSIEDGDGTVTFLSDEDSNSFISLVFQNFATNSRKYASDKGCAEGFETILKACSDYMGGIDY